MSHSDSNRDRENEFKRWASKYNDFIGSSEAEPPATVTASIKENIYQMLHPSQPFVFSKLFAIHFLISLVTLFVCPQFGIGFTESSLVFQFFSSLGPTVCMSLCGAFFVIFSVFTASLLLKPEEVRAIRSHKFGQIISTGMLSTGLLIFFGAELTLFTWGTWFTGLLVFGIFSLELGWKVRTLQVSS